MFRTIQYIGNKDLLKRKKTLFVCSKKAPIETYGKIFEWVESLTELDVVVCCNTTELEEEVLKSLLVNKVSTIFVIINKFREENNLQIQKALAEGRILILVMEQTNKKRWSPRDRNEYLVKITDYIVGGYIDKHGSLFPLLNGKKNFKALTNNFVSDIITEPDNSYQRWTVNEDKTLLRMYYEDQSIHEIKKQLGRTYIAIRQRIRAITMPEDVLKGREFEEFVLELLDVKSGKHILKEWRGDKTLGEVFPENNCYPDLIVEEAVKKHCISIECKWRKHLTSVTIMELFDSKNLIHYQQFSQNSKLPVFIVLGIGGNPCEPDDIYIIPLEKASFKPAPDEKDASKLVYDPSQLNVFKRAVTDTPLSFDDFGLEAHILPHSQLKGHQSDYMVETRKEYANAYKPWTPLDDNMLTQLFKESRSIQELSQIFNRKPSGIRSRLKKLGLI